MSPRRKAQFAFLSSLLLFALTAVAAYFSTVRLVATEQLVDHTQEVQIAVGDVNMAVSRAGRDRGSYISIGDQDSRNDFAPAVEDIAPKISRLRTLTRNDRALQSLCDQLQDVASQRIGLYRLSLETGTSGAGDADTQALITRQLVPLQMKFADLLRQMSEQERSLQAERQVRSDRLLRITVALLCFTLVLAICLFFVQFAVLSNELSARELAESDSHALTTRLLRLQDDERRKFARELHDSIGQYLAGMKMMLEILNARHPHDPEGQEMKKVLDQTISEVRTLSYLLHPPGLDEAGLAAAAKWFAEEFSKRSGVEVSVDIPELKSRLTPAVELVLFRVLQESLTNIYRHSKSPRAEIQLRVSEAEAVLRVRDFGVGVPPNILKRFENQGTSGVGLAGMRGRVEDLGGDFEVVSDAAGTLITAAIPFPYSSRAELPLQASSA
jgi:signal transduction histidine kinase